MKVQGRGDGENDGVESASAPAREILFESCAVDVCGIKGKGWERGGVVDDESGV